MRAFTLVLLLVSFPDVLLQFVRPTNSAAASRRGVEAFEKGDYRESVEAFSDAARIRPGPQPAFALGTATIAAGDPARGAALLEQALSDETTAPDAHFNRGNVALHADRLDEAIAEYADTLRARPGDVAAKRNLEIALRRKESEEKQQQEGGENAPQPDDQSEQNQEGSGQPQPSEGKQDLEALLRSIEQQEREELSRMRRSRSEQRRVGW
ncbi:MAG TPA: tetratricopeptide repeat protein [Thermoanaerobaculia bacterium]|nr:tetratricopeptide repeat protein [Thermoanaerobaculia bacterium]